MERVSALRGAGRWDEALELVSDPLARADILNEQALFAGGERARRSAEEELDRAEALLELGRGRILHAAFLGSREPDRAELAHFERALELALALRDTAIEGWARLWIGLYRQVVEHDGAASLPSFDAAYRIGSEVGDRVLMSYAARHLAFEDDRLGDHDRAWARWEESVRLRREEGFLPAVAAGLLTLGEVAAERGRPDDARALLEEALDLARRSGADAFAPRIESALAAL
jgi:tetratricopeptide (TPR) repeat protein